jgi:hypothetical protein
VASRICRCPSGDGQPIWLSVDGELATAESGFTQGKHRQRLIVYRVAAG